ncbi:sigma-54 interaction domain-containing protein [Desulfocurvus sp. DL9XJH121]
MSSALVHGILNSPVPFLPLLDEIPLAVLLLDTRRRVVAMNQAAEVLIGFPARRSLGLPCRYALRGSLCGRSCPLAGLDRDSSPACAEGDIINADRERIPVRVTASPVRAADGSVQGYMETVEDLRLLRNLEPSQQAAFGYAGIIGHSPKMEKLFQLLPSVAQTDSSVLITGETGTGKDLVAEAIHQSSDRAKGPFVKVNCGALPETLLEGELFGHVKGAFTGAVENKSGRFKLAHNGTLFLTEIGDLPLPLQVKLLSFLDDKTFYPLGGTKPVKVDVRIIAATLRDLEEMVAQRLFREDLLYRLNVVRMHLPPLRERGEDLEMLTDHFLAMFRASFGKEVKSLGPRTRDILLGHPFPGNVRELRNVVEYAVNVCEGDTVLPEHLPAYMTRPHPAPAPRPVEPGAPAPPRAAARPHAPNWDAAERELIMDALVQAKGRRGRAADILGWGRSTLWRKMKKHGIDPQGPPA